MPKNITQLIFSILFCCVFSFAVAEAKNAFISDILVTNTTENVLLYCKIQNCFTQKLEEAIFAGIPVTFAFSVELYRERTGWFDDKERSFEIKHTIKYDSVKKLYYISYSEASRSIEQYQDLVKAEAAMSDINGIDLIPLRALEKDKKYYIRVRAKLDKIDLPLHLEYVFFFVSLWDFETDWVREDFIY